MNSINVEKLKRIKLENEFTLAKMKKIEELKNFNDIRREQMENLEAEKKFHDYKQEDLRRALDKSCKNVKSLMESIIEEQNRKIDKEKTDSIEYN